MERGWHVQVEGADRDLMGWEVGHLAGRVIL